jgi:starch phosphorylase
MKTNQVNNLLRHGYNAMQYYTNNMWINRIVNAIRNGIGRPGHEIGFPDIANSLLFNNMGNVADPYLLLADFEDYCRVQNIASDTYLDSKKWNRMGLVNTAMSGMFAADRSVLEYDERIWHLTHLTK